MKITLNDRQVSEALKRYVALTFSISEKQIKVATVTRHHGGHVTADIFVEEDTE